MEVKWTEKGEGVLKKCGWVGVKLEGGEEIECVVDSGADISLISEAWAKKLGAKVDNSIKYLLTGASKGEIPSSGTTSVSLDFGTVKLRQTFVIIPDFKYDLILGEDFLVLNKVIIDYNDKSLKVRGKVVPFVAKNEIAVRNTKKIMRIEAKTQQMVVAEVMGEFKGGGEF